MFEHKLKSAQMINLSDTIYWPSTWLTQIELIKHLVTARQHPMIVVDAEQGGGKTVFAELLCQQLAPQVSTITMSAQQQDDEQKMVARVFKALGLPQTAQPWRPGISNTSQSLQTPSFATILEHTQQNQTHVLLIIDDAHVLQEQVVQTIFEQVISKQDKAFFHVCLIADTNFSERFISSLQHKEYVYRLSLGYLAEQDIKSYVIQRFLNQSPWLQDEYLQTLFKSTEGNLVKINKALNGCLSNNALSKERQQKTCWSFKRLICLGAVCVLFMVFFALKMGTSESVDKYHQPLAMKSQMSAKQNDKTPHEHAYLVSQVPPYHVNATRRQVQPALLHRQDLVNLDESDHEFRDDMVLMDKVIVIPKVIHPSVEKPKNAAQQSDYKAGHYTVQILASPRLEAVQQFIKKHQLQHKTRVLETQKNGKTWYLLTLGTYPSKEAAQSAIRNLPREVSALSMWVRPTRALQRLA